MMLYVPWQVVQWIVVFCSSLGSLDLCGNFLKAVVVATVGCGAVD